MLIKLKKIFNKRFSNDILLKEKIEAQFHASTTINASEITVISKKNEVTLYGKVSNQENYRQVLKIIRNVNGINSIRSDIRIGAN